MYVNKYVFNHIPTNVYNSFNLKTPPLLNQIVMFKTGEQKNLK